MRRRDVLKFGALSAGAGALRGSVAALPFSVPAAASGPIPIIDAHIHMFDPLRSDVFLPQLSQGLNEKPNQSARRFHIARCGLPELDSRWSNFNCLGWTIGQKNRFGGNLFRQAK